MQNSRYELRVSFEDVVEDYETGLCYGPTSELFTGLAFDTNRATGQLETETEYIDGLKHGIKRRWHFNGSLEFEAQYWRGMPHGEMRTWYENGRLKSWSKWELGCVIEETDWDTLGATSQHRMDSRRDLGTLTLKRNAYGTPPLPVALEDHGQWPRAS